jgi:hypothetical protein
MAEQEQTGEVKMRQIIIETDGTSVNVVKSEVFSQIELLAILQMIMAHVTNKNEKRN